MSISMVFLVGLWTDELGTKRLTGTIWRQLIMITSNMILSFPILERSADDPPYLNVGKNNRIHDVD